MQDMERERMRDSEKKRNWLAMEISKCMQSQVIGYTQKCYRFYKRYSTKVLTFYLSLSLSLSLCRLLVHYLPLSLSPSFFISFIIFLPPSHSPSLSLSSTITLSPLLFSLSVHLNSFLQSSSSLIFSYPLTNIVTPPKAAGIEIMNLGILSWRRIYLHKVLNNTDNTQTIAYIKR